MVVLLSGGHAGRLFGERRDLRVKNNLLAPADEMIE
jgi:hypothetical protein